MKIIKLNSENFKYIKAVEITPDANFQIISGKNGQGKSSVLDSIWSALEGRAALKDTDKPIRNGQEKSVTTVDLGEIIVVRKFTASGTTLEVKTKDGAKYSSPQKILDDLIGKLSFDPLQFSYMDSKEQVKTLQELIGFDPSELDNEYTQLFEERTEVNRVVKSLTGQLEGMNKPSQDTPDEETSASSILTELREAQEVQKSNDAKRETYEDVKNDYGRTQSEIKKIEEQIESLTKQLNQYEVDLANIAEYGKKLKTEVNALVDPDLNSYQERLEKVEETNAKVRAKKQYTEVANHLTKQRSESEALNKKLDEIKQQKSDMLKQAKFPIEGLSFGETGVEFNQVPLKQCCDSEGLKVSVSIAMALNPKLRVIRMKNGSLLDSDNLKMIEEMAKDKDYQVWIELVDETGGMGVVIEDGQVKVKEVV